MEYKLPNVSELDSTSPDYAINLDNGMLFLVQQMRILGTELRDVNNKSQKDLIAKLTGIAGVTVVKGDSLEDEIEFGNGSSISTQIQDYTVSIANTEDMRTIEDIITQSSRELRNNTETIDDKITNVKRSVFDHLTAMYHQTTSKPLVDPVFDKRDVHFYIPRATSGEVYELHISQEKDQVSDLTLNPNLKPEYFEDPQTLEKFKEGSKGMRSNVYVATNPCRTISHNIVALGALDAYFTEYLNHLTEKMGESGSEPVEKLLASLKRSFESKFKPE